MLNSDKALNATLAILGVGLIMAASGAYTNKACTELKGSSECKTKYETLRAKVNSKAFYNDSSRHTIELDLGYRTLDLYSSGKDAISIDSLLEAGDLVVFNIKKPGCFCYFSDYNSISPSEIVSINGKKIDF